MIVRALVAMMSLSLCIVASPGRAERLRLSCYLTDAVDGSHPKNPPELPITADTDAMEVMLFGGERETGVEITAEAIVFSRGDDLFSIDRDSGAIQIISKSNPAQIVRGQCSAGTKKF